MTIKFHQLNQGWNAEPNAPNPVIEVEGSDVLLKFSMNSHMFEEFDDDDVGILRFVRCEKYRLGPTNDEGWYSGQCRFSSLAPSWGEFYEIEGDAALLNPPDDWEYVTPGQRVLRHFLFYLRDSTFECIAERCIVDARRENSLYRHDKTIRASA